MGLGVAPAGFDGAKFLDLQSYHGRNQSQITPYEYAGVGGNLNDYSTMYGNTAWYKPDGNLTSAAPAGTLPASLNSNLLFPKYSAPEVKLPQATRYEDYLPKNIQSSPLYKFQLDQGMDALRKNYSARGLLDSGAELESARRLATQLGAEESERVAGRAETVAGRQQDINFAQAELQRLRGEGQQRYATENANRLVGIQNEDANRTERYNNEQWSRLMQVIQQMLNQSPAGAGLAGTQGQAGIASQSGQAVSTLMQQIAGTLASRANVAPPPITGGPDYSGSNYANSQYSSGLNYGSLLGNAASYLLG